MQLTIDNGQVTIVHRFSYLIFPQERVLFNLTRIIIKFMIIKMTQFNLAF
jgi:hypothetical protein